MDSFFVYVCVGVIYTFIIGAHQLSTVPIAYHSDFIFVLVFAFPLPWFILVPQFATATETKLANPIVYIICTVWLLLSGFMTLQFAVNIFDAYETKIGTSALVIGVLHLALGVMMLIGPLVHWLCVHLTTVRYDALLDYDL